MAINGMNMDAWDARCVHKGFLQTQLGKAYDEYLKEAEFQGDTAQLELHAMINEGSDEELFEYLTGSRKRLQALSLGANSGLGDGEDRWRAQFEKYKKGAAFTPEKLEEACSSLLPDLTKANESLFFRRYGHILSVPVPPEVNYKRFALFFVLNKLRLVDEAFAEEFKKLKRMPALVRIRDRDNLPNDEKSLLVEEYADLEQPSKKARSQEMWKFRPAMEKLDLLEVSPRIAHSPEFADQKLVLRYLFNYDQSPKTWKAFGVLQEFLEESRPYPPVLGGHGKGWNWLEMPTYLSIHSKFRPRETRDMSYLDDELEVLNKIRAKRGRRPAYEDDYLSVRNTALLNARRFIDYLDC